MTHSGEPSYGTDCPPWCTRKHAPVDHLEDRRHRGEATTVIGAAAVTDGSTLAPRPRAAEIVVQRFQDAGDARSWIAIQEAEQACHGLVVSAETALALSEALARAAA